MKNRLLFVAGFLVFVGLVGYSLNRELLRETGRVTNGINGVVHLKGVGHQVIKTDNLHLFLVEPETMKLVAAHVINPFVPPTTFYIGQEHALDGQVLSGSYHLWMVSDKNASPDRPGPGEVTGPVTAPIPLGTEEYRYDMNEVYTQLPTELIRKAPVSETISGTITIAPELQHLVESSDRLIILLFDPEKGRPVAFKIMPSVKNGQTFSISSANAMSPQPLSGAYSLRILTDKNQQPFHSVEGEIVGRSENLIPLGTQNITLELNQHYQR